MANRAPEKKNRETHPRFVSSIVFSPYSLLETREETYSIGRRYQNKYTLIQYCKKLVIVIVRQMYTPSSSSLCFDSRCFIRIYVKKKRIDQATITRLLLPSIIYQPLSSSSRSFARAIEKSLSLSLSPFSRSRNRRDIKSSSKSNVFNVSPAHSEKSNEEDTTRPTRFTARSRRRSGVTSDP